MSKNERIKAGLHKEISSIFKGVVIPRKEDGTESSITSIPEDTGHAVSAGPAIESQKDEVLMPYQTAETLHEAEPAQESKAEPIQESRVEPVEEPKAEPVRETNAEPVQEPKAEPVEEFKVESVEQPKVEPDEESKAEPVQESKVEPVAEPKVEPVEESKVEPVQQSKVESVEQPKVEPVEESKVEPAHTPKFLTAQESKVIPLEESEVEPTQEAEDKSVSSPKFLTAQESEVGPAKEPETDSPQKPESDPAHKSKFKKPEKPKVIPVQKSKKTGIEKISKKVSEKRSVMKAGNKSSWKQITSKLFAAKPGASTTKQKAMVVMIPVLFIALLVFVFRGGIFGTSVHNAQASGEENTTGVASTGSSAEIDWEIPEPYPTTLRDPVKLGSTVKSNNQTGSESFAELRVRSILISEDRSSAIIGSSIVHEGDEIGGGVKIIKISKDGIEFEMNGKKWTQGVQR